MKIHFQKIETRFLAKIHTVLFSFFYVLNQFSFSWFKGDYTVIFYFFPSPDSFLTRGPAGNPLYIP